MGKQEGPTIYVVTPPELPRALRLADELYNLGWDVEIADTPELGAQAGASGNCIIMLTRDGWRDPALVEAIRRRPAVLVPVLAEQMPLPNGPWTTEPIEMRYSLAEVAALVVNAIDMPTGRAAVARAPATPRREASFPPPPTRQPSRPRFDEEPLYPPTRQPSRPRFDEEPLYPPTRQPSRPRDPYDNYASRGNEGFGSSRLRAMNGPYDGQDEGRMSSRRSAVVSAKTPPPRRTALPQILGIVFLILALVGAGFGIRYVQSHPSILAKLGLGGTSKTAQLPAYTAAIPGADCDKGGGVWKATANQNYTFACQADAFQVTQKGGFDTSSGVFFTGNNGTIAQNYQVQVNAAIQSNEGSNTAGLIVHLASVDDPSIASGQEFLVNARGQWDIVRVATAGNTRLAIGFLSQPAKTYTLAVDVNGAILTYSLNGNIVATVTDTTYKGTTAVGLLVANPSGKQPALINFAQFKFQPLADPSPAADLAAASTATATANQAIQTAYSAAVPGPGCDKGTAQWASPVQLSLDGTVTCADTTVTIAKTAKVGDSSFIGYYGQNGLLPLSYKVELTINSSKLVDGCAVIGTKYSTKGTYLFAICKDGSWDISLFQAATGVKTKLKAGYVAAATTYTVAVTDNGGAKTFTINGQTATATNAILTDTSAIVLGVITAPGATEPVIFSNFKVTPVQNG